MRLILKEINNLKCINYLKGRLDEMLYFSKAISHELSLNNGKFYTIIPGDANEKYLYDFEIGGRIYPYKREEGVSIQQVINHSESIIITSLHEYVSSDKSHCICLEDYTAKPIHKYVQESGRLYYLIDDRIFYLIDDTYSLEEIDQYFNWANSFGFLCMVLKMPSGLVA